MSKLSKNSPVQFKVQVWIYCFDASKGAYQVLTLLTTQERGSFWQPVTGSVNPGESLTEAAWREAQEETGLRFHSGPQALSGAFEFQSRWGGLVQEHAFMVEAQAREDGAAPLVVLDAHEHVDYQWRSVEEAFGLLHYASNQEKLTQVAQILNNEALINKQSKT